MAKGTGVLTVNKFVPGWFTLKPPVEIPPGAASVCTNVDLSSGTCKRRFGWTDYAASNSYGGLDVSAVYATGGFDAFNLAVLVVAGNSLYSVASPSATPTLVTSTLASSPAPTLPLHVNFAEANGAVYMAIQDSAGNSYPLRKWDGTTFSVSTSPSTYLVVFANDGLFVVDAAQPNTLQWSGLVGQTGIDTWPATNFITLDQGDGDAIYGLGFVHNALLVLKQTSVFRVTGQQPDDASVGTGTISVVNLKASSGCNGQFTASSKNDMCIWYNNTGLFSYDGIHIRELTEQVRPFFQGLTGPFVGAWVNWHQYGLVCTYQGVPSLLLLSFNPNSISLWQFTGPTATSALLAVASTRVDTRPEFFLAFSKGSGSFGTAAMCTPTQNSDKGVAIQWQYTTGMLPEGDALEVKVHRQGWYRFTPGTDNFTATVIPDFSSSGSAAVVATASADSVGTARVLHPAAGRAFQLQFSTGTGAQTGAPPEVLEVSLPVRVLPRG